MIHVLRRAAELIEAQTAGAVRMPLAVKRLFKDALALRDHRASLSAHRFACKRAVLERRFDRPLRGRYRVAESERFRRHLLKPREQWLVSLYDPDVEPTNNLAERELRGAVVIRKIGGCNRTDAHAKAHAVIASVAQTAHRTDMLLSDFVSTWLQPRDGPWDEIQHALHPFSLRMPSSGAVTLRA
jgi:transposase